MLGKIRALISEHASHELFFRSVGRYFPPGGGDYNLIEKAYIETRKTCREQKRDDGGDYFSHPRAVATIVLHYLRERDPEIIVGALTHDLVEDFPEIWSHRRMQTEFTSGAAEHVWWITKPPVADFGGDKEARNRHYHGLLRRAPRSSLVIKMPDRLHNTITLENSSLEKQKRKVRETQDFYLPLAEDHHLLVHEIEAGLDEVMSSWKSSTA
jgi:GTP diphosphokinase / guanosine-3',5'-bis(diphosphate) 3'-diphosphatase